MKYDLAVLSASLRRGKQLPGSVDYSSWHFHCKQLQHHKMKCALFFLVPVSKGHGLEGSGRLSVSVGVMESCMGRDFCGGGFVGQKQRACQNFN